ncbi:Sec7-domain-containing protein [Artomyces pyxidatus]|uniref:Sec7-domain-containing protein n=1 Tax=Artomyces pyxidatus TaxID=48021 RepID=A0ACB8T828_9AGAM|nr:Sec7-domain-containing protein [Artomyces pyxidatus]
MPSNRLGISYSEENGTVSPKHVVYSEILSVTSVMRKNSRWASSTQTFNTRDSALASNLGLRRSGTSRSTSNLRSSHEDELMSGFEELKRELRNVHDLASIPITQILAPFFALIRSPLSTGPITSAALSSLHSFFGCGLISRSLDRLSLDIALAELSSAVSQCKFEASDSSGDEVVLLRILAVIEDCLCGSVGELLGDIEVCEMLETVLTTCVQMRLSEALRRSAGLSLHNLVRTVFYRLHTLDPEEEEAKLTRSQEGPTGEIDLSVASPTAAEPLDQPPASQEVQEEITPPVQQSAQPPVKHEYGLPSLVELLRVIINILDPNDRLHTDSTRLLALAVLNTSFEVSGPRIGDFPSLRTMVLDHGCKYLFQLARSDNPSVIHLALRTISTMLTTMRKHLKLQQELFLAFTLDRLAPPMTGKPIRFGTPTPRAGPFSPRPGTPNHASPKLEPSPDEGELEKGSPAPNRPTVLPARGETRDLLLETLSLISPHPSFMVELFTNYDCDINAENLFERLVDLLSKGVYSEYYGDTQQHSSLNSQYLSLDLLLTFVNCMATRAEGNDSPWPSQYVRPEELSERKSKKKLILTGATRFNTKPKTGLAFLEENGLIYHDLSPEVSRPQSLARFLKSSTRLDKKLLGDFISKPDNIELLKAFIGLFDFHEKPIADAMREMLETFRLPGEAQQIARITETFAEIYFASQPAEIKSQDAVYVLAYSVIMLNTDLHNPQIRKRMTIEDYQRNLRGVNDGSDFSPEYLQSLYDSIRKREIVMPEEHTGQLGFEFAWKELLARSRQSGELMICNSALFDKDMFTSVWKPVISAITYAFMTFDDDYIIERAIAGFRQCATLAGRFQLPDVFDYVVVSLSQATSLLSESLPTEVPMYPVVEVEGQSVTVSTLAVNFGAHLKGQLAAVVLFNIMNGNGNAIREGWTQVFEILQNLFIHSLLPTRMLQMEDFLGGVSMIPLRGSSNQAPRPPPRSDGLLSTLSSYLMTPYSSTQETLVPSASDADVENTLCALDCITTCRLEELYAQIVQLDLEPLTAAVRSIEALAYERTVAKLQHGTDDLDGSITPLDGPAHALSYDPASVFLLEMMVSIVCQTPQHIEELWPIIFEHLTALLSKSTQYSVLLIERAVVSLLRICLILTTKPSLRDQIYLSFDLLGGLPPSVANSVSEQTILGLVLIVQKHREVISSQTEWNLVLALVRSTVSHLEAARTSFDLVQRLVMEGPEQCVTTDNITGLVAVLDDFATAAGFVVEAEQQHARRRPKSDSASSPVIDRGRKAVDLLVEILKLIPRLSDDLSGYKNERRHLLALPILSSLSRQSTSASLEVRHAALSQLSRALLGPLVMPQAGEVDELFQRVVYPLLDALISAPRSPETTETRLRASVLLCKAFMRFEVGEGQGKVDVRKVDVRALWVQVLDYLDQLMQVDRSDQMSEAVPESLKNVILVMNAAGMLVPPPSTPEDSRDEMQQLLWQATEEKIEQFLPGFLLSVIPAPPPPPPPQSVPEAAAVDTTA